GEGHAALEAVHGEARLEEGEAQRPGGVPGPVEPGRENPGRGVGGAGAGGGYSSQTANAEREASAWPALAGRRAARDAAAGLRAAVALRAGRDGLGLGGGPFVGRAAGRGS